MNALLGSYKMKVVALVSALVFAVVVPDGSVLAANVEYWDGVSDSNQTHTYGPIALNGGYTNDNVNASDWVYIRTLDYDYRILHQAASNHWYVELVHINRWNNRSSCKQIDSIPGGVDITCVAYKL